MIGCGGNRLYPVEGKVTFKNGNPYSGGGQVVFEPTDKDVKTSARGILQPNGSFRMGTFHDTDGVAEGRYRVAVVPAWRHIPERARPDPPPFDKRFSSQSASGLECVVKPGRNEFNITIEK
jgi:hypothetical protein